MINNVDISAHIIQLYKFIFYEAITVTINLSVRISDINRF